jgi:hypothetical protein
MTIVLVRVELVGTWGIEVVDRERKLGGLTRCSAEEQVTLDH